MSEAENKELEETIKTLKRLVEFYNNEEYESYEALSYCEIEAIETVLKELNNSISKEKVLKKLKEQEKLRKKYWEENDIMINFIDKKSSIISQEKLKINDKHMQLNGATKILQELLEEK